MIRVVLPAQLRALAGVGPQVELEVRGALTQGALLDALEVEHPELAGTIRDRQTGRRRPLVRFYACEEDLSDEPPESLLPEPVAAGREPFLIIGAIAGG